MPPYAYLRKSRVTSDRHVSQDVQEAAVRELAERHGDLAGLRILHDWNRSGRRGADGRPGYRALLEAIEAGSVTALYGYSLSRLSRSLSDFTALVELCTRRGVPIRLARDHLDFASASGRLLVNVLAAIAAMEAELAQERVRDAIAYRRARGDTLGSAGYGSRLAGGKLEDRDDEPVAAVLDAWREAGTFAGAARLLNAAGVPCRRARGWSNVTVAAVVRRHEPEAPAMGAGKPWERRSHILAGLVRCHCGALMVTRQNAHTGPRIGAATYRGLRCPASRSWPDHPRPFIVGEAALLPWIKTEAARLRVPVAMVKEAGDDAHARGELLAMRERIVGSYIEGLLDRGERDRRLLAVTDELERLDIAASVRIVPQRVDWSADPGLINAVLRAIWSEVRLGPDLRPIKATWIDPSWRADDASKAAAVEAVA